MPTLAGASRFCHEPVVAPPVKDTPAFVRWLMKRGATSPGAFLYPTSDEVAWLISAHREQLAQHFVLFQPDLAVLLSLLDKSRLYRLAAQLGIDTPATFFPTSDEAVRALGHELEQSAGYPVIVKPRTQACMSVKLKGKVVHSTAQLQAAVAALREASFATARLWPDASDEVRWPLVQAYRAEAQQHTYSLAGFVDAGGTIRAARASSKVFQIPVQVGVGVAFEGRAVQARQLAQVQALMNAAGYFGIFEVEFIHVPAQERYLLMDFNPRIYGQMQFEVARGMLLPLMVHAAAVGDTATADALTADAVTAVRVGSAVAERYCDSWTFRMLLGAQHLGGRLSAQERTRWVDWMSHPGVIDAVAASDDPAPHTARRLTFARQLVRHPRASLRTLFR